MASSTRALLSKAFLITVLAAPLGCGGDSIGDLPDATVSDATSVPDADTTPVAAVCSSTPGTRLTREFIEPAAGARQEFDIVDSELEEVCSFLVEADGSYTCYPESFESLIRFQDAACTSAIVGVSVGAVPKAFARARRLSDGACFLGRHFRRVGMPSAVTGGQTVFSQDTTGTCSQVTAPTRDYYLAGPELPISSFVTATRGASNAPSRLATAAFAGSDGSSMCDFTGSLVDTNLAAECSPGFGADSELYCLPSARNPTDVFNNAGCTDQTSVVVVDRCEDDPPAYARTTEPLTCGATGTTVQAVTSMALAQRFVDSGGSCVADSGTDLFFPVGETVVNSEFVSLTNELEVGGERLTRSLLSDGQTFLGFQGLWRDTVLETDCQFRAAVDGSFRCLPEPLSSGLFFTNATCTTAIQLALNDSCQDGRSHFTANAPLGRRVLSSAPHPDPVFVRSGADCNPANGSFLVPSFELAPSSFVEGTISEL